MILKIENYIKNILFINLKIFNILKNILKFYNLIKLINIIKIKNLNFKNYFQIYKTKLIFQK